MDDRMKNDPLKVWQGETVEIVMTKDMVAFLLSAVNNYGGMGVTRDKVAKALKGAFSPEEYAFIRKVWGYKR